MSKPIGYACISKSSKELQLVRNPDLHHLPHVFPIYAEDRAPHKSGHVEPLPRLPVSPDDVEDAMQTAIISAFNSVGFNNKELRTAALEVAFEVFRKRLKEKS